MKNPTTLLGERIPPTRFAQRDAVIAGMHFRTLPFADNFAVGRGRLREKGCMCSLGRVRWRHSRISRSSLICCSRIFVAFFCYGFIFIWSCFFLACFRQEEIWMHFWFYFFLLPQPSYVSRLLDEKMHGPNMNAFACGIIYKFNLDLIFRVQISLSFHSR